PTTLTSSLSPTPTPPTHLSTLSLHDALPISPPPAGPPPPPTTCGRSAPPTPPAQRQPKPCAGRMAAQFWWLGRSSILGKVAVLSDRKSTRLNSSHVKISYAVFCLKKKKK